MSSFNTVGERMDYIQHVFLKIQNYIHQHPGKDELIDLLEEVPAEYRSVAYEAASMEISMKDLVSGGEMNEWKKFYLLYRENHSFHMEIGLGWAFAKTEFQPASYLEPFHTILPWMVYDGIGYYYGLFKGRRTVKHHQVPERITAEQIHGFDQGLGRRLWYISRGDIGQLEQNMGSFPEIRHGDLWRGVGIACGYVGGTEKSCLEKLVTYSGAHKKNLATGIALAALSRKCSDTAGQDLDDACTSICGMRFQDVIRIETIRMIGLDANTHDMYPQWIRQLEKEFS